jgi:hypothetical protein
MMKAARNSRIVRRERNSRIEPRSIDRSYPPQEHCCNIEHSKRSGQTS